MIDLLFSIGFCKECSHPLYESDNMSLAGHPELYECENCGYPHAIQDITPIGEL